jgi:hypothetical protein
MKQRKKPLSRVTAWIAAMGCAAMLAQTAWSVEPGQSYLGLGFGQSEFSGMDGIATAWPGTTGAQSDETSLAWKLYTGYQFRHWLAVETACVDFGDLRARADLQGTDMAALKISPNGFEFSGLATWSVTGDVQVFLRAGMLAWRAAQKFSLPEGVNGADFSRPERDGFSPALGAGGQWDFSPRSSLRLEWQQYPDLADSDPQTWMLSAIRRF